MPKTPMDHLRSRKKPAVRTVEIAGDSELAQSLNEAKEELRRVEARLQARGLDASARQADSRVIELGETVAALTQKYRLTAIKFRFESLGRKKYEKLLLAHPPTKEQKQEAGDRADQLMFNADTFPEALILESMVEPALTTDEMKAEFIAWTEELNQQEYVDLFNAAFAANNVRTVVELGKG